MNDHINDLRLEAGISRLKDDPKFMVAISEEGKVIEPLDGLQKFAELIVKECAKIAHSNADVDETYDYACHTIAWKIKEHFGVKE